MPYYQIVVEYIYRILSTSKLSESSILMSRSIDMRSFRVARRGTRHIHEIFHPNRLVIVMALSCANALGQSVISSDPPRPPLVPAVQLDLEPRIGIAGDIQITLGEFLQFVLSNNREIVVASLARKRGDLNLIAAKGYFDPVVGGNGHILRQVSPEASSLGGAINGAVTQKEFFFNPQVSGISPWLGTTYKLDFASSRIDNNNTFNTLNPTYPTAATLNLTQPLWGGLRFDLNRERLSVAKKDLSQSKEQFRQRVIEVTTQAVHSYCELDFALRNLSVQIGTVRLAEQQDASNRRQVELGIEASSDLIQTQTQIAIYQQNIFYAQQQVAEAENTVKRLMLPDGNDPLWNVAIRTVSLPSLDGRAPTLSEALQEAFADRPDLKSEHIEVQISELTARLAREKARPQINLTAKLSAQGLAGRTVAQSTDIFGTLFTPLFSRVNDLSSLAGLPPLDTSGLASTNSAPDFFIGGYGQSLSTLRDVRFPTFQLGIQVSLPVGNRTAHAEAAVADSNRKQTVAQQQQLEMVVISEVRSGLQRLVSAGSILEATHRAAQLAQKQYESEERQFAAGNSSVYLVLQRQIALTSTKLREIRAETDWCEAQADLDRATASTLRRQNIDILAEEKRLP